MEGGPSSRITTLAYHNVFVDPGHMDHLSSVNLLRNNATYQTESTAAVRNCDSPITVAKTVKLRAELCRAAVCFPSFGM